MAIIIEVPIGTSWVDVNTEASILVGTAMSFMNKGNNSVFITESATEPVEENEGKLMTSIGFPYATGIASSGSLRIWCRCVSERGTTLAVQEGV